jgi:putative ABC transport system permease protein
VLSGIGIALGVGAIVAVLGLSASSQAGLLAQIDALGTNLLTVSNGQNLSGDEAELPTRAPAMIARIAGVTAVDYAGRVPGATAYRSPFIPRANTNGLSVQAASADLPDTVGTTVAQGRYLNAATAREPVAVLGAAAARLLGIDRVLAGERIWVAHRWFYLAGILAPATLAPGLDAAVLIGFPAAERYLAFDGHPSTVYLRTATDRVNDVHARLAATTNPQAPSDLQISRPSDALVARAEAKRALDGLFLGLGAVSLLVGAVGIANTMVVSVLERRPEIGLRRALGASRGHIRVQFLLEAVLLAAAGGVVGVAAGVLATTAYARHHQHWDVVIPTVAWAGGLAAAGIIGGLAGLLPALRAARMSPTRALWSL